MNKNKEALLSDQILQQCPYNLGDSKQNPWLMPETVHSTEHYIHYIFPMHTYDKV